jgi:hypothetical protein
MKEENESREQKEEEGRDQMSLPRRCKTTLPKRSQKNRAIGKKVHDVVNMGMWRR